MLTGQLPFGISGQSRGRRFAQALPDARDIVPSIRPATCMLMEKITIPIRPARYQTYRDLQNDLGLLL